MKAVLALIVLYVGTFLIVIQGASQSNAAHAQQKTAASQTVSSQAGAIDPDKEADIRSLMELVGARDLVQEGVNNSTEQYREKLSSTVPNNEKGQAFVNAFVDSYLKKFDVDAVTNQLVTVYDQHFTHDEIKGLLQFYGSPLGQKVAAEMPQVTRDIQARSRAVGAKAAKETLQALKEKYPEIGQQARLAGPGQGQGQGQWQGQRRVQRGFGQPQAQNQPAPNQP